MTRMPLEGDVLADDSSPPSERLLAQERKDRLMAAIDELPPEQREVVWFRLDAALTFREIADITDAPLNTILSRMHQAKARLRQRLGEPL